jgi:hypothetical protein
MDIDRRKLLAGSTCLALAGLVESAVTYCRSDTAERHEEPPWHPLTRSLLDRARRANATDGRADTASIERLIRDVASAQGCVNPPVIEWRTDPSDAFDSLKRLGLDALLQMSDAHLWRRAGPQAYADDDRLNSAAVLRSRITGLVRSAEHDNALIAPKLLSKDRVMAESASADTVFKVRAVAAQIGWLETCIPVVAAQAVTDVELFLSSGAPEESIHHQLRVFEAYELGLLATWATPDALMCVPRMIAV